MSGSMQIGPSGGPELRQDESLAASQAAQNCADANSASEKPAVAASNPLVEKYEECWRGVQEQPSNFTLWTTLIAAAEKLDDIQRIRSTLEAFLKYYPLCYGYWKKFADAEARHGKGDNSHCLSVFERGVTATPYSTDLWGHYATYKTSIAESPENVRSVYERGLSYCGTDYTSHGLWDKYLAYEEEQQQRGNISALLCRVIKCPLKELDKYMKKLREFVKTASIPDLMLDAEADAIRKKLATQASAAAGSGTTDAGQPLESASTPADEGAPGEAAPGEECPPGEEEAAAGSTTAAMEVIGDAEVVAQWLSDQEKVYQSTKTELETLQQYLTPLKRPYFHVKPLDTTQLATWVKYLDFMEARGDEDACTTVYERCLVPCAAYPEFWERYAMWLEKSGRMEAAEAAVQRMTSIFCRIQPQAHMFAARFDERRGAIDSARERYRLLLLEVAPRLLSAIIAAANFERRQGQKDAACAHFETFLYEERAKETPCGTLLPFMSLQYANFLRQAYQDVEKGRTVIDKALTEFPASKMLWEGAAFYEECIGGSEAILRALKLLEKGSTKPAEKSSAPAEGDAKESKNKEGLSVAEREDLSTRAVELARMFGSAEELHAAERRHFECFVMPGVLQGSSEASRKRQLEAGSGAQGNQSKLVRGSGHADAGAEAKAQHAAWAAAGAGYAAVAADHKSKAAAPWPGAVPGGYPAAAAGTVGAQAGPAGAYYGTAAAAYPYPAYGAAGAYPYPGQY